MASSSPKKASSLGPECVNCCASGQPLTCCGRCLNALYCSKDCQVDHWTKTHKQFCKLPGSMPEILGKISADEEVCCFCLDPMKPETTFRLVCGHNHEVDCFVLYVETFFASKKGDLVCPFCRYTLKLSDVLQGLDAVSGSVVSATAGMEKVFRAACKAFPKDAAHARGYGRFLFRMHKLPEAEVAVQRAIRYERDAGAKFADQMQLVAVQMAQLNFAEAVQQLIDLYKVKPNHVDVLFELVRIFTMLRKFDSARLNVVRILKLNPEHTGARMYEPLVFFCAGVTKDVPHLPEKMDVYWGFSYGSFQVFQGKDDIAELIFQKVLDKLAADEASGEWVDRRMFASTWSSLGRIQASVGMAKTSFLAALKYNDADVDAWIGLCNVACVVGDNVEAKRCAGRAVLVAPNNASMLCELASIFLKSEYVTESADYVKACLKLSPKMADAKKLYGEVLKRMKEVTAFSESITEDFRRAEEAFKAHNYVEAVAMFERLLEYFTGSSSILRRCYYYLGVGRTRLDDVVGAQRAFELLYNEDPSCVEAAYLYGVGLKNTKEYEKAKAVFESCVALDANHAPTYFMLGNTCVSLEDFASAETAYRQSLQLDATNYKAWCNLGMLLARKQVVQDAESDQCFLNAIKLLPTYTLALTQFATQLAQRGEFFRASSYYLEACKHGELCIDLRANLGVCLYKMQDFVEAVKAFEIVLSAEPNNETACLYIGRILYQQGTPVAAKEYLQRILAVNPDHKEAADGLAIIKQAPDFKLLTSSFSPNMFLLD